MPFPLAHPAAILPFRRYCPRYLSLPALVVGSICPDLAYIFGDRGLSDKSHTFFGGIVFGLIAGLLLLSLFHAGVSLAWKIVPRQYQRVLLPLKEEPLGSATVVVSSLCLGVATHVWLDSFTHTDGWLALHVAVLRSPVLVFMGRQVRVCHLLWYACSFVGVACLPLAFRQWQTNRFPGAPVLSRKLRVFEALFFAALVLPIELLHHIVRSRFGLVIVVALSVGLLLGVLARIAQAQPHAAKGGAPAPSKP